MTFFENIKDIYSKITEIENNIYCRNKDYREIYERNLQLEREIEQRTNELNIANKRLLTLQHIRDMINSSEPAQNIPETILDNLKGELGYIHSRLIRDYETEELFSQAILEKEIKTTSNVSLLKNEISGAKLLIIIPLYTQNKPLGVFAVVSSRPAISEAEKDFLAIFARQIEMAITIAELFKAVKSQAVTDSLTGLYNRRCFEEQTAKEVTRAIRQKQPFSIIGLDLDHLKRINDKHGHSFGDMAIKTVADVLKKNARSIDIPARLGGEEFSILLPGIDSEGAMAAAERLRKAIADEKLDTVGHISASIGVATFLEHSDNIDELMELTDQAMYRSKRDGRNRVTLAKHVSETSWQEIAVNTFADILSKRNIPIPKDLTVQLQEKLKNSDKDMLYSVSDMLAKTYNPAHAEGVTKSKNIMAVMLAKRFDLPKEEVDNLRVAMLLYDIGNMMVPSKILQKAGPLTDDEKKSVQEHPLIAVQNILKPISYIQNVIPIIEHHHENWDGTGYPQHKSKGEIPLTSQIVLIVDAYFALTEPRPYRAKMSSAEAVALIKEDSGKKWNPSLVDEFTALIEQENNSTILIS